MLETKKSPPTFSLRFYLPVSLPLPFCCLERRPVGQASSLPVPYDSLCCAAHRETAEKNAQEIVKLEVAQITQNDMLPDQTNCKSAKSAVILTVNCPLAFAWNRLMHSDINTTVEAATV